jgi:hypothetical protein
MLVLSDIILVILPALLTQLLPAVACKLDLAQSSQKLPAMQ